MTEKRERDVLKESIKRQTEGNESIYFPSGKEKRERNVFDQYLDKRRRRNSIYNNNRAHVTLRLNWQPWSKFLIAKSNYTTQFMNRIKRVRRLR